MTVVPAVPPDLPTDRVVHRSGLFWWRCRCGRAEWAWTEPWASLRLAWHVCNPNRKEIP